METVETKEPIHKATLRYLSRRTIILIVILAGFTIITLIAALRPQWNTQQQVAVSIIPTPTPFAQSLLTLQPSLNSSTTAAVTKSYDVIITSNINTINAVQLELAYDPTVLTNVKILKGTFFPDPIQLVKDIDIKNGRISYALGIQPVDKGIRGTGIVATITFQLQPSATVSSTVLSFLPKTKVAGQGISQSVLKTAMGITVPVALQPGTTNPLQR